MWSARDVNFATKYSQHQLQGVRVLSIDPLECLLSFICSSCNNIPRITQLVQSLCRVYGRDFGDGVHSMPAVTALVDQEQQLRELGFGYRAKYIAGTAAMLIEKSK